MRGAPSAGLPIFPDIMLRFTATRAYRIPREEWAHSARTRSAEYRRHLRTCQFFGPGGREARADKCNCPFHFDGIHDQTRHRGSLKTRSRQLADRRLAKLMRELDEKSAVKRGEEELAPAGQAPPATAVTLPDAVARFLKTYGEVGPDGKYRGDAEYGTWKKYRCSLRFLMAFSETAGIRDIGEITVEALDDFRSTRDIGRIAWKVERQMLMTFFGFCIRRKWCSGNPAKELEAPKNLKPNEVVP